MLSDNGGMRVTTVRIMRCGRRYGWYEGKIGSEYEVYVGGTRYIVKADWDAGSLWAPYAIDFRDAVEVCDEES